MTNKLGKLATIILVLMAATILIALVTGNLIYFEDQSARIYGWSVCLGALCN